jgi:signal transduction histidine kinase
MKPTMIVPERAHTTPEILSIVHDLRNPLSTIHGGAEMLINSALSRLEVHRIARNMHGASARMMELLDEVLNPSKGGDSGVECSDLRELVASAVDKIALLAEAQAVQVVQKVPENVVVAFHRQRIQRVLINLLINALEVMPSGGLIRISAILLADQVLIKVRDTGPGIAREIQARLFQPFATAGKARGLGLGLAFSREAVTDHGGEIWAESSLKGTCFAVRLPIIPQTGMASW